MSKDDPVRSAFLKKLSEITEANISNEDFGVKELAQEMGISHSQIHRKLQAISKQSTSQFIREVRLNKGKEMLKQELCTASEVAYKVGFSSPSYFNKCFHDYFGYTPGEYKKHVDESHEGKTNTIFSEQTTQSASGKIKSGNKKLIFIGVGALFIILFSMFIYIFMNEETTKNSVKSIAVLPLTNLSDDPNNQHLADGIMNDISNRLSRIRRFEVKSSISSKAYNSTDKSIYEIGKELGVSYIIEGSLYKTKDGVRLFVHLIHTKKDKTMWSRKYDDDLSDIISFISNVSRQITDELEAVLTPEENEQLDKKYTLNNEAYNLYSEGRFYWQLRGEENLRKSIDYFNRALEIDPDYCLPYVGLADAYALLSWLRFDPWQQNIPKSKRFIEKALAIDKNLAEAHTALGMIASSFEWDWNLAEKEFLKAIELNPNYATAHHWYSDYLCIIGEAEKARLHIDKALQLKPHTRNFLQASHNQYLRYGNYSKALEVSEKMFSIDNKIDDLYYRRFNVFFRSGNGPEASDAYKKYLVVKLGEYDTQSLDRIYSVTGLGGIIRHHLDRQLRKEIDDGNKYFIARIYAILGEKQKALDYLTIACENREPNILRLKYEIDFMSLHDEPHFLALLEMMNLGGY